LIGSIGIKLLPFIFFWNSSCWLAYHSLVGKPEIITMSPFMLRHSLRLYEYLKSLRTLVNSSLFVAIFLAHMIFLVLLGFRAIGYLQPLEMMNYDFMLSHHAQNKPIDPRITMLQLTDADQRRWGWPLSDHLLTEMFHRLLTYEPRVIGLDIYRDLPVPIDDKEGHKRLSDVLQQNPDIITIMKFANEDGNYVPPPAILEGTDQVSFNDVTYDDGFIIRRGLLFLDDGEGNWNEYFGLKLAMRYLAKNNIYMSNNAEGNLVLGETLLPPPLSPDFGAYVDNDADGYQFLFSYPGAPRKIPSLTLTDLFNSNFNPDLIRDKIIVIGTYAEATPDYFSTPVGRFLEGEQRMAGVAVHAYGTSHLLRWALGETQPLQSMTELQEKAWIWFWTLLGALLCLRIMGIWQFIAVSIGGIALLGGVVFVAFEQSWWLLGATPMIGWLLSMMMVIAYQAYKERSERATLMNLFSRHVSKDVAKVIWQCRDQYLSEGKLVSQRLTATVVFTDLQNFTTVSEAMEPQVLMDWLNDYMSAMVKIVEVHNGQVNKFIGDAIMAVFGIPIADETEAAIAKNAENAVNCALAMRSEIDRLREQWAAEGMPLIRMRVGIYTGPLVAGSLGGEERQEYTVLGDTVNTAARLESFDKTLDADNNCRILIGDPTLSYLADQFQTESVGTVHLKGKAELVSIHLVEGRYPDEERLLMQAEVNKHLS